METVNLEPNAIITHCIVESNYEERICGLADMYGRPEKFNTWLVAEDLISEIKHKTELILNEKYAV